MNSPISSRLLFFLAVLVFAATASAQAPAPSPSPSPSAAGSSVVDDPAADLERAVAQALRSAEDARRKVEANRAGIEREARQAATTMATATETRARASAEARVAVERALQESRSDRGRAAREAGLEAQGEAQAAARAKAQEARDRAREKAREQRDRDREKAREQRDREREQSDSVDDLYELAMEAIDEEDWADALRPLGRLVSLNNRVDAALYWTGYAQGKLNRTAGALESLTRLQKEFPASRWAREGKALEMEVREKSGQTPRPDQEDDLDLKLMAVSALAQSDPQEAMPILARILQAPSSSRKVKERSLFVLAQMGTGPAGKAIADVARGNSSPELQRKAIQYLGVFGGVGNRRILSEVYASTTDNTLRKQILNSFMVSGDKARVLDAAKNEKDPALRGDAVRLLGVMGGTTELDQMYATATSAEEKKAILHALFIGGAVQPVAAAARREKDKDVRLAAVRNLGLMGRRSQDVLVELYGTEIDQDVKKEVLNAFFLQNNATRLVEVARAEKDPMLKKEAVHWLSLMNSKESRAYMMEVLKD